MATGQEIYRAFQRAIPDGVTGPVVVAYSGGADSTALLDLFVRLSLEGGPTVVAAHFHHGLRNDSDEEEMHCRRHAKALGVRFLAGRDDTRGKARSQGQSLEEAARNLRYSFLFEVAAEVGSSVIALGHNRNDQAETVLARIVRGTGLRGLGGMSSSRVRSDAAGREVLLLRPLLGVTGDELRSYVKERCLETVWDQSNEDQTFTRNRVRLLLLPAIEKDFNPSVVRALCGLADTAREWYGAEEERVSRDARSLVALQDGQVRVRGEVMMRGDPVLLHFVLRHAFKKAGLRPGSLRRSHYLAAEKVLTGSPTSDINLPGGISLLGDGEDLLLVKTRPRDEQMTKSWFRTLMPGVRFSDPGSSMDIEVSEAMPRPTSWKPDTDSMVETVDADRLAFPLALRTRRPGDRIQPLGAPGTMKLKKFLCLTGVINRDRLPLLIDQKGRIVWVVGVRLAHFARVVNDTRTLVNLRAWHAMPDRGEV